MDHKAERPERQQGQQGPHGAEAAGRPVSTVVTTLELIALLEAAGSPAEQSLLLPLLVAPPPQVLAHYSEQDQDLLLAASGAPRRITSVEYLHDEPVQCIAVADEGHLYLSDDFVVTHNTSNIVFLKSTDDSMIGTLETMSGKTHRTHATSKSITQNLDKMIGGKTDGAISRTYSTEERPLITYNDMAFIAPNQNIVFRAGNAPIWNRNETIFPMAWRLFKNKIVTPGTEYSLQTIPTMSSAIDFDVRMNQPDFEAMAKKRMAQATMSKEAQGKYKELFGYEDVDIERLDPDVYAKDVMRGINVAAGLTPRAYDDDEGDRAYMAAAMAEPNPYNFDDAEVLENQAMMEEIENQAVAQAAREDLVYAERTISVSMLLNADGSARIRSQMDQVIVEAYLAVLKEMERDTANFRVGPDGELCSADGSEVYISTESSSQHVEAMQVLNEASGAPDRRVYAEAEITEADLAALSTRTVHTAFYLFLAGLDSWEHLAGGAFDRAMAKEMIHGRQDD